MNKNIFILLQINDALFPIGAYSHSYGLETYIQKNIVKDIDTVFKYLKCNLKTTILYTELLSISLAYDYAKDNKLNEIIRLEEIINASKIPSEIRLASQKLGSRFIKTVEAIEISTKGQIFNDYIKASKEIQPTHSVAYGVFCSAVGIEKIKAIEGFLYSYTSSTITTCVKSIPLSQTHGQRLLYKSYEIFEEILSILPSLTLKDLCISTPGFDIRCMQHETLYSRLYMS
ncbi:MAG: urease accessory protein UreF [Paraclostridium sordellii]|uniref:urease accessory protein UreF n=1 Tax=Paraclostridium sordellii TaxID=1505 RepID=UPI000543E26B|nr:MULTISPECIES: urease accessory protein UreF [Paeniclostridium]MBW4862422.1 urease accessory protein UreF [Paeniclostridium sp.]MBW4872710.1 urease accessory protein UreF [Paeniclostridium sp.]MDU1453886.1 urease accessory protein UreF [Paeniclostridium sordellii]CEK33802.1 urease accessory protein UreF,Urease accessory protein UreF,Urease accessory protein UreF,UreF [[Clostridium] sordellii] [Paeniclostridium sordellii]CEN75232.1 urease accessory protein UreF [[Clostridium] sordellii] [Paen